MTVVARRVLLAVLGGWLLGIPLVVGAQPAKIFRVAVLSPNVRPAATPDTFRQTLANFGYVAGRNLVLDTYWMGGRERDYPTVVASLVGNVDVVMAITNTAALAVRELAETTPVVFSYVSDPVGLGLVKTLGRPGGNMTGIADIISELVAKGWSYSVSFCPGCLESPYS